VTSVRRSTLQRIENGFGDLPDGLGPETFAVYAYANSAAVFEKLNGTPVSQLAIKGAQLRRAGRLGIPGECGTRAGNCFARLRKFFSVPFCDLFSAVGLGAVRVQPHLS